MHQICHLNWFLYKDYTQTIDNINHNIKRKTPLITELRDKLKEYAILKTKNLEREEQQRSKRTRNKLNQRDNSKQILSILQKEKNLSKFKKRKTKYSTFDSRFKEPKIQIKNIISKKDIANPFIDNKTLKLTWAARWILEFLKVMFPSPMSLKVIKSAINMHKISTSNSITRLIALKLFEAKKVYNQESNRYESLYLITNSASGKGPP